MQDEFLVAAAVAYVRYSSPAQSAISIEAQIAEIQKYCEVKGIRVIKVYSEPKQSARTEDRNIWQEMMQDLREKKLPVRYIVVHSVDRWARDLADAAWYKKQLEKLGYTLLSAKEDISDNLIFAMYAAIAEKYSERLSEEIRTKNRYVAKHAYFLGGVPPFGFKLKEIIDNEGKKRKVYQVEQEEAEIVRLIFQKAANRESLTSIADWLNRSGIKTQRGGCWGKNTIYELLRNERYKGTFVYGKGSKRNYHADRPDAIRMENAIPAIVKSELWESVNSNRYKRRESQYNYMLRGIAYCWCGSPLVGGKVGKEPAYRCSNAKNYHLKGHIQIMASILEGRTWDALKATWLDRDEKEIFDRMKEREILESVRDERTSEIVSRIAEIDTKVNNAVTSILEGSILNTELSTEIANLKATRELLTEELRSMKNESVHGISTEEFQKLWREFRQLDKSAVVQAMISSIRVSKSKYIDITWRYPL